MFKTNFNSHSTTSLPSIALSHIDDDEGLPLLAKEKDKSFSDENPSAGTALLLNQGGSTNSTRLYGLAASLGIGKSSNVEEAELDEKSAQDEQHTQEKAEKLNGLLKLLKTPLSFESDLPKLTPEAEAMIQEKNGEYVAFKVDKGAVRALYAELKEKNDQLSKEKQKPDDELWREAVDNSDMLKRTVFGGLRKLAERRGRGPKAATAVATMNTALYPVTTLVRKLTPQSVIERRAVERNRKEMEEGFAQAREQRNTEPVDLMPTFARQTEELSEEEIESIEDIMTGAEAYRKMSDEQRAGLDSLLQHVEKHGAPSTVEELDKPMRESLEIYRDTADRLQRQTWQKHKRTRFALGGGEALNVVLE